MDAGEDDPFRRELACRPRSRRGDVPAAPPELGEFGCLLEMFVEQEEGLGGGLEWVPQEVQVRRTQPGAAGWRLA